MRFKKYINNISADEAHTNNDNISGASPQASYEARKRIDIQRQRVGSYGKSIIGNTFLQARHNYRHSRLRVGADSSATASGESLRTRQEMNSGAPDERGSSSYPQGSTSRQEMNSRSSQPRFREPPSRGYDPYQ